MPNNKDGPLYGKFFVSRVDGRDAAGGDKEDARYFVLDYTHDEFARDALEFYADSCTRKYPQLANDIRKKLAKR